MGLRGILRRILQDLDLEESGPKCNIFIVEPTLDDMIKAQAASSRPLEIQPREQKRQRMTRDLTRQEKGSAEEREEGLRDSWKFSFKILGAIIDDNMREVRTKAIKRLTILHRAAKSVGTGEPHLVYCFSCVARKHCQLWSCGGTDAL